MKNTLISKLIYTNEKCQGCNRCISVCPVLTANCSVQYDDNKSQRIDVHSENCIACGACFDACEHNARRYYDDTEDFFNDLKKGEKISVLVAPSFIANYPEEYSSVLGGLKELGVNHIISVSFGADITTWGYLNYITEHTDAYGMIAQPCPAVVNYIERYAPELINKLMPVQSPLMCTAIYAKKYMKITDKLAFISPCIAKKSEINDPNNHGYVSYNMTFSNFMNYVKKNNVRGKDVSDEIEYGLGSVYPMPGGLKENVYWFCGDDAFIRQVEGQNHAYNFLKDYVKRINGGKELPFMVDILNCSRGCIYGTGIERVKSNSDDNYYNLHAIKEKCRNNNRLAAFIAELSPHERLEKLNKSFSMLAPADFVRKYTDKSDMISLKTASDAELNKIFTEMKKNTPEKRLINCGACGYENCRTMAQAIYNGINVKENCIHYMKDQEKQSELIIDQMIQSFAKSIDIKDKYTKGHSQRVALYVHMIALRMGVDEETAKKYYRVALLHDIGKVLVPTEILNKEGKLTDEEYAIIKMHSQNGRNILEAITSFPELAEGAGGHHERPDGRGYPNGLKAEQISFVAKLIAAADTFDAMNSTRSYRKKLDMDYIVNELNRVKGTQLDREVTDTLLEIIAEGGGKIDIDEELM